MRFTVFTILVISVKNLKAMPLTFNFTVPEGKNCVYQCNQLSFGSQSVIENFLFSEVVQDVLDTFGTLTVFNQLGQLQDIVGHLAVLDYICLHELLLFVASLNKVDEWALQSKF